MVLAQWMIIYLKRHNLPPSHHASNPRDEPASTIMVAPGVPQPSPAWLHVDQLIREWIFATICKDTSCKVQNISYVLATWQYLASCFNSASSTRASYLKCMLTNVSKGTYQSMETYLCHIKALANSLAEIQSYVSDLELIQFTKSGLPPDYHSLVTTYSMLPGNHTFDDLRSKLIFHEK